MAYTQDDLNTITQAIIDLGSGRRKVRCTIAGDSMEYAAVDLPALRSLRAEIQDEVAAQTGADPGFCLVTSGKGY
jgi:hypothetical protein